MSVFKRVGDLFVRFPGTTQGTVASVLQVTGDVIAQKVFEKRENLDLRRSVNFAVLGFFSGYVQMKWYGYLFTRFQDKHLLRNALKKLAVDQLTFAPALTFSQMVFVAYTESGNFDETKKIVSESVVDIFKTGYSFWTPAQFINFYYLPLKYQVAYNSILAVAWETYFSYKMYLSVEGEGKKKQDAEIETVAQ